MRILKSTAAVIAFAAAILILLQYAASERVEVVQLHTRDESGATVTTRLWVVDDENYQYLRVGANGSGWFSRLQHNDYFQVTRNGETDTYTGIQRPEKSQRINQLMREKYTWGDRLISVLTGSREASIPIELRKFAQATAQP